MKRIYLVLIYISILLLLLVTLVDYTKRKQGFVVRKMAYTRDGNYVYDGTNWTNSSTNIGYYLDIIYMTRNSKFQKGTIYVSKDVWDSADKYDIVQYSGKPWDGINGHYSNGWYFNNITFAYTLP